MSNLEELIERLCPDGVEYKPLWSVTAWDKKFNAVDRSMQPKTYSYHVLLAKDLFAMKQETGDVFLLSTGVETGWTTEEIAGDFMCEGEVVTIPWGKSSPVKGLIKYYNGKFVTGDNRIATSLNTDVLDNKYLYYWMVNNGEAIDKFYRGSGIKHPSMYDVLTMKLPVPPLEVQREIVRILDNFTFLTTELAAELAARQKQYEYYKEYLFENHIFDVEWKRLDELFPFIRNGFVGTIKSFFTNETDGIRYLEGTNIHDGVISDNEVLYVTKEFHKKHIKNQLKSDDILMVQSGHIGECAVVGKKYEGSNCHALIIMSNGGKCLSKYYVYYFHTIKGFKSLTPAITGGTIKHVLAGKVGKIKVPVPSLEQQQRIVDILDRFDTLCNDISSGLPAEIEARQKQYEYYRDKLLTFKELKKEA